jgi:hypothetical protein
LTNTNPGVETRYDIYHTAQFSENGVMDTQKSFLLNGDLIDSSNRQSKSLMLLTAFIKPMQIASYLGTSRGDRRGQAAKATRFRCTLTILCMVRTTSQQ